MNLLKFIYGWLKRLPWRFSVGLVVSLLLWLVVISTILKYFELRTIAEAITKITFTSSLAQTAFSGELEYVFGVIPVFFEGLVVVLITLAGLVVSYNVAAVFNQKARFKPQVDVHDPVQPTPGKSTILQEFVEKYGIQDLRIGIINAGGGAKGAYQAGALKAIYEFLEENNALDKVKMIAGTSIGSWNSMFWLAGLVKPPAKGEMSAHEKWWKSVSIKGLVDFANYFPLAKNSFLHTTPWQETFLDIFKNHPSVQQYLMKHLFDDPDKAMHFYLTRSNVESGKLEFATNNASLPKMERTKWQRGKAVGKEPVVPPEEYELIQKGDEADALERMKMAVFASMDLPPMFPYMEIDQKYFEDGGVVDNLPLRFGAGIEKCNLLFVLPLNASFHAEADHKSVFKRLFRVMNIRQGVLERESMKITRLYNEKARLSNPQNPALVSLFTICPNQPLVIETSELWKTAEAGQAFDLMYEATKKEIHNNFMELADPDWLRMALVNPDGTVEYREDF